MNNFNDLKAPLTWALGIVFIVCIFMLNANTIKVPTGVGTGDAWNPTQNMQEWNFDNSTGAFIAGFSNLNNSNFNFGVPSSADILFFEEEEIIDIEALIEEIIAEMDEEDDSTATSPSEE